MVEKAGHNKMMQKMRVDWINEGRPKDTSGMETFQEQEDQQQNKGPGASRQAEQIAPVLDRLGTPEMDDLFEDDIYNATPIGRGKNSGTTDKTDEPNKDILEALMAEAGGSERVEHMGRKSSIFGDGRPKAAGNPQQVVTEEPEEDDLDALLAEAEADGASGQDMTKTRDVVGGDEEDLDALIGKAERRIPPREHFGADRPDPEQLTAQEFNDDEEAMAEMDGLW